MFIIDEEVYHTIVCSRGLFIYRHELLMDYVKIGEERMTRKCPYFLNLEGIF